MKKNKSEVTLCIVKKGSKDKKLVSIKADKMVVGRESNSDIVIDEDFASGCHCEILREKGLFFIRDLDSRNGTFINGRRIKEKTRLHRGEKIQIGDTRITIKGLKFSAPNMVSAILPIAIAFTVITGLLIYKYVNKPKPLQIGGGGYSVWTATQIQQSLPNPLSGLQVDVKTFTPRNGENRIEMRVPDLPQGENVKLRKRTIKIKGKLRRSE